LNAISLYALVLQGAARPRFVHDTIKVLVHDTVFVAQPDRVRVTDWISVGLTFALVLVAAVTIGVEIWRERVR